MGRPLRVASRAVKRGRRLRKSHAPPARQSLLSSTEETQPADVDGEPMHDALGPDALGSDSLGPESIDWDEPAPESSEQPITRPESVIEELAPPQLSRMSRPPAPALAFGSSAPADELEDDYDDEDEEHDDEDEEHDDEDEEHDDQDEEHDDQEGKCDDDSAPAPDSAPNSDYDEEADHEDEHEDDYDDEDRGYDDEERGSDDEHDYEDEDEDEDEDRGYDDEVLSDRVEDAPFDETTLVSSRTDGGDLPESEREPVAVRVEAARDRWVDEPPLSRRGANRRRASFQRGVGITVGVIGLLAVGLTAKSMMQPKPDRAERHQATAAAVTAGAVAETAKEKAAAAPTAPAEPAPEATAEEPPAEPAATDDPAAVVDWSKVRAETLRLLKAREPAKAEKWARRLIALRPEDAFGYRCLGAALQDQGNWPAAREAYSQCVTHATEGDRAECKSLGGVMRK